MTPDERAMEIAEAVVAVWKDGCNKPDGLALCVAVALEGYAREKMNEKLEEATQVVGLWDVHPERIAAGLILLAGRIRELNLPSPKKPEKVGT